MKNNEEIKTLDLHIAKDAREFLSHIRVDGKTVTEFILKSGKVISVSDMTDDQAICYANHLYFDLFGGEDGGGHVDTHIRTGAN